MLTTTCTMLLTGIADPANDEAWGEFDARYRPIIVAFARKLGLGSADADDVAQETMLRFVREFRDGKYDRGRGQLRSWLFAMARFCVMDLRRAAARRDDWRGESALGELPVESELQTLFDAEWRHATLQQALDELRAGSGDRPAVRVLELFAVQNKTASEVAAELEMTLSAVYVAKHRALEMLRSVLARLESDF